MTAASVICAFLLAVSLAYAAYDSWACGVSDGGEGSLMGASSHAMTFRALYVLGYRVGAEALYLERLNRGAK